MKIVLRIIMGILLVSLGFAAGFPIGQSRGFSTGSEWAFMQASIIAREMGLFMPVNFVEGNFKITLKQPHGHFRRTRQLAEKYGEKIKYESRHEKTLAQNEVLIRRTYLTR
jgi:hypothetical protein